MAGDAEIAEILKAAWAASLAEDDTLTHGFHAYPARMHGGLARAIIGAFGRPSATLLDPFCGSGTTLVEAMVAGMQSTGIDLNPVATWVSAIKCELRDAATRRRFLESVTQVVQASLLRIKSRAPVKAPLHASERQFYAPHVLKELGGLHAEIETCECEADRRAMLVLLSAIVVKFSNLRADSSQDTAEKRIGKGVPTRFWGRKAEELVARWAALGEACDLLPRVHPPRIHEADARQLKETLGEAFRADLVLTSPPYGGTYDYAQHHARRYPWLGVSAERFLDREIGARRNLGGRGRRAPADRERVDRWNGEVLAVLRSLAPLLAKDAIMVWVMGDGHVGNQRIRADRQLAVLAPEAGLQLVASASQERVDWHGGPARAEHLLAFTLAPSDQGRRRRPVSAGTRTWR